MSKLTWDEVGTRLYETGTDRCVLYPYSKENAAKPYPNGVAWSGITAVSENPSGAEATALWADNIKYLNLISNEEFAATIEAYTYPEEFEACDGTAELVPGVALAQQTRKTFGLSYRTLIGNDTEGTDKGYKIHLVYGCTAAPSSKSYATVNDSPEAITFSWSVSTIPVEVDGFKSTAHIIIDSTKITPANLKKLEDAIYGTDSDNAYLPLPSELKTLLAAG